MALIQITPEELTNKAGTLRASRAKHDEAMNEIGTLINALNSVWKGPAQDAFVERFNSMKGQIREFSEMLEQYAKLMDTAAADMQQADESLAAKVKNV